MCDRHDRRGYSLQLRRKLNVDDAQYITIGRVEITAYLTRRRSS